MQDPRSQNDLSLMAQVLDMFYAQKEYCFRGWECFNALTSRSQLFIPFTFAILFLISHQYELDPLLIFFGQSETTPFRTLTICEPYVKKLLLGRAVWVSIIIAACTTALSLIIFWAVPGHRL